jgi:hypothetical protein
MAAMSNTDHLNREFDPTDPTTQQLLLAMRNRHPDDHTNVYEDIIAYNIEQKSLRSCDALETANVNRYFTINYIRQCLQLYPTKRDMMINKTNIQFNLVETAFLELQPAMTLGRYVLSNYNLALHKIRTDARQELKKSYKLAEQIRTSASRGRAAVARQAPSYVEASHLDDEGRYIAPNEIDDIIALPKPLITSEVFAIDSDAVTCKSCMTNAPQYVSASCGHFNFCHECRINAPVDIKCPTCRADIKYLRIYH